MCPLVAASKFDWDLINAPTLAHSRTGLPVQKGTRNILSRSFQFCVLDVVCRCIPCAYFSFVTIWGKVDRIILGIHTDTLYGVRIQSTTYSVHQHRHQLCVAAGKRHVYVCLRGIAQCEPRKWSASSLALVVITVALYFWDLSRRVHGHGHD